METGCRWRPAKGKTLRKQWKAGKFTVLSEIRANFESSPEFCDVSKSSKAWESKRLRRSPV
jgi:hypothetical protein